VTATVPHITSGSGLRTFQADGFLFDRVYTLHIKYHYMSTVRNFQVAAHL